MTGGDLVADVLVEHGVRHLFTLCGGHISPILVSSKQRDVQVIDVRDEASAVFAADAVSRLTGTPGVAAVTAGPGVTNTLTAIKNAQLAQSPLVLIGGATGTILEGRGSLQDIDQEALMRPHVKWLRSVSRVADLAPTLERAFEQAQRGVPGPVFVECPVDLLYEESLVRDIYGVGDDAEAPKGLKDKALRWYLDRHLDKLFAGAGEAQASTPRWIVPQDPDPGDVEKAAQDLAAGERPVLLVGSQAILRAREAEAVAEAVESLGVPVYLSGMARGLLGARSERQMRHKRTRALREADLVILAGVPCDFRLDYGRSISGKARLISVNLSREDLKKNRKPDFGILAEPGRFLQRLAGAFEPPEDGWPEWTAELAERDAERDRDIEGRAEAETEYVNPVHLCREIERALPDESILAADGGDFVATASYVLRPRGPLRWLDPGVFGTLGVGGGFALGAKAVHPEAEVWLLWGDGSAAYSLAEFDTYVRHRLPVIAVVGNDASWQQIAREQVEILGDACGTELRRTDYHRVAEGYGGRGILVERPGQVREALAEAQKIARGGEPVLVNVLLGKTDFRKGSISM